jgi:hypothetical protein
VSVVFDSTQGLVIVLAQIYGPTGDTVVRLALDTGAVGTLINPVILAAIGYDLTQVSDQIRIVTSSGIENVSRLVLPQIGSLGQAREDFLITCHSLPAATGVDGLLGLDFCRRQRLIIDFRVGEVTLD